MKSKDGNMTPKEAAQSIILGWITAVYKGVTDDLYHVDDRDSFRVRVRQQLAAEHNRLLRRSGMDGLELDATTTKLPRAVASTTKFEEQP